jgi:hypothetical protein
VDGDDLLADQGSDDRVEFHVSESGQRGKPGLGESRPTNGGSRPSALSAPPLVAVTRRARHSSTVALSLQFAGSGVLIGDRGLGGALRG